MLFENLKNYYILRYVIYEFLKKVLGVPQPTCLVRVHCARVDGGPLAQPGEVAGHEVRGGRGHVCVHWGGHRHQAVGHQVQVVLGVPAGGHEGPGLPRGERRHWILSGN